MPASRYNQIMARKRNAAARREAAANFQGRFEIWTRRMNDQPWSLYGVFDTQQAFNSELPHINAQGLAMKRVNL